MYKIKISDLSKILNYEIKKDFCSIGLDLATRTGYTRIKTDKIYAHFDWQFFKLSTDNKQRYIEMVKHLNPLIEKDSFIVIEDTHMREFKIGNKIIRTNPEMFKKLTRFGGIAITLAILQEHKNVEWIFVGPLTVRSRLKVYTGRPAKGEAKGLVKKWVEEKLGIMLENDEDIRDAIVMACGGICEGIDFEPKTKKKKVKKHVTKSKK